MLNEIISLTLISWFTVTLVNREDATDTRGEKKVLWPILNQETCQAVKKRSQTFVPQPFSIASWSAVRRDYASYMRNAESTVHHKTLRFSQLFNHSLYIFTFNTQVV